MNDDEQLPGTTEGKSKYAYNNRENNRIIVLNDYSHGIKITSVRGMDLSPADKGQKLILQEETHEC